MKKISLILLLVISVITVSTISSCGGGKEKEENPLADSLAGENSNLQGQLSEKEKVLQTFVTTFNEIQANLNEIKEKEKIVTKSSTSGDVKSKEDQIKDDIQSIYELLAKNKSKLNSLNKKLKNANTKIEGLELMIANLEAQITEKDNQIAELKKELEEKSIDLANLQMNFEELEQETEVKTEKLNSAFYAIGTAKELKENNVITKEGGFIGMGKTTTLKDDFNKEYFTKIDITETKSILLGAKKIKILTTHPSTSYKLIGEKPIEKLEITNAEDFWGASKYLVIVIEN